jgi:hypothetical protein
MKVERDIVDGNERRLTRALKCFADIVKVTEAATL